MLTPKLLDQIRKELVADEGLRPRCYDDATGKAPVLAQWRDGKLVPSTTKNGSPGKLTIGIGRNISDRELSSAAIEFLFREDLDIAERAARRIFPAFDAWTQNRQSAVVNLVMNMGETTFLGFHETVPLMRAGRWKEVAQHLAASKWATDVQPSRRDRIIKQVGEG